LKSVPRKSRFELLSNEQAIGVAEEACAEVVLGVVAPEEIAEMRELTEAVGRAAVLPARELKAEDKAGEMEIEGLFAKLLIAEERAGEAVTAGPERRLDRKEAKAGLIVAPPPTEAVTPAAGVATTEDAALTREEAAPVGIAAPVAPAAREDNRVEMVGATVSAGFAERKLSAEDAAGWTPPALFEVTALATELSKLDSWEAALDPAPTPTPPDETPAPLPRPLVAEGL
jgi:hypothetical protein